MSDEDPWHCAGFAGNDWRIVRECVDCERYRKPHKDGDEVYWLSPPMAMPCPNRKEKGRA